MTNQTPTIYLAKRMLVDSIWKEAPTENTVTHNDDFMNNDTVKSRIMNLITDSPNVTAQKMSERTGKSLRTIRRYLKDMQTNGLIKRVGSDKTGHWEMAEKSFEMDDR